ncbi:unnamed protein product [Schistosoma mattheei]|uniref:Uncharacterized protein n=1 Tax=Schistosoma mattheei TaxID=31246 RepID=A0A183P6C5_9TREM|nr:unnamed protein product [Schistosoma mattheei]
MKIGPSLWITLYPECRNPRRFHGLRKIHKKNKSLRPVFDFMNSPKYELAKYLASVLKLHEKLVNHGIKTTGFKNNIDTIHLKENEMMASFNISSIFITVTISPNFEFLVPV